MYQVLKKNWDKSKYLIFSGIFIASILLLTVVYKSDEKIIKKSATVAISYENPDLKTFKEFLLNQIKSPFTNLNYEIKKIIYIFVEVCTTNFGNLTVHTSLLLYFTI